MCAAANTVRTAILGASGYTGAELVRLLSCHPSAEMAALTADRRAGAPMGSIFPHLAGVALRRRQATARALPWNALIIRRATARFFTTKIIV